MQARPLDPVSQLREEQDAYAALVPGAERLSVWQPQYALVVTTAEARLPTFARAAALARSRGTPVHARGSGGGAVCLGPGTLVVSHLYTSLRNDIDAAYRQFSGALIEAVAGLGIEVAARRVEHAYCDGRFDLAWRGIKLGGMAQRRSARDGFARVWIHAVLSIADESRRYPEEVERFYRDLGTMRVADARVATSLSECLPPGACRADLMGRCVTAIGRQFASADRRPILDPQIQPRFA